MGETQSSGLGHLCVGWKTDILIELFPPHESLSTLLAPISMIIADSVTPLRTAVINNFSLFKLLSINTKWRRYVQKCFSVQKVIFRKYNTLSFFAPLPKTESSEMIKLHLEEFFVWVRLTVYTT